MKFEQAFYTWSRNQLSRYKTGLGICATSNLEDRFMDKCMKIGALFAVEENEGTAEFMLYSENVGAFVGVGVSPSFEQAGDGRANSLCHLFLPEKRMECEVGEEYLVYQYPFQREVQKGAHLEEVELTAEKYDYIEVLDKYNLNQWKLAELLWKAFGCVFDREKNCTVVIDKGKYEEADFSAVAREVMWLLSKLVPRPIGNELLYVRKLSYGVHTTMNKSIVRFLFTDQEDEKNNFYLGEVENAENIPEVFYAIAGYAMNSWHKVQEFLGQLLSCNPYNYLDVGHMELLYIRWKMDHGYKVTANQINKYMAELVNGSISSEWKRNLLQDFALQEKFNDVSSIINCWEGGVLTEVKQYPEMEDEKKKKIFELAKKCMESMYSLDKINYCYFVEESGMELGRDVLISLFNNEADCIMNDIDAISSSKDIQAVLKQYESLKGYVPFSQKILTIIGEIYEVSERSEREDITACMNQVDGELWEAYLMNRLNRYEQVRPFTEFLSGEIDRMEGSQLAVCYELLLDFAKNAQEEDYDMIIEAEESMVNRYENDLCAEQMQKFAAIRKTWEIKIQARRILAMDLEELLNLDVKEIAHIESRKTWFRQIEKKAEKLDEMSDGTFERMCQTLLEGYESYDEGDIADYLFTMKLFTEDSIKRLIMYYSLLVQTNQTKIMKKVFWSDIDLDEETLLEIEKYKTESCLQGAVDDMGTIKRKMYLLWEKVKNHRMIDDRKLDDFRGFDKNSVFTALDFLKVLEMKIAGFSEKLIPEDVCNFFAVQKQKELISRKKRGDYENVYKEWENQYTAISEFVRNNECPESVSGNTKEKWHHFHIYLLAKYHSIDRNNLQETYDFIVRVQSVLGEHACIVDKLYAEYDEEVMQYKIEEWRARKGRILDSFDFSIY